MNTKVSVIVPIYGVEGYIERCSRSLFAQTLKELEFIFVDDCSPDESISILLGILKEYPERKHQVKIVRQPINSGQASARETGIRLATGEYIIHCDPDDWIDLDAYEIMYNRAIETDADIVTCKHYEYNGKSEIVKGVSFDGEALEALISNKYTFTIWDKLVRNSLIKKHNIYPFKGINYGEDLNITVRLLCYASKVAGVNEPLYHYDITRSSAITKSNYKELLFSQALQNLKMLDNFLEIRSKELDNPAINKTTLNNQKFWLKWGLFANKEFEQWASLWPESHKNILKLKSLNWRFRIFLRIFCNKPKSLYLIYALKNKCLKF